MDGGAWKKQEVITSSLVLFGATLLLIEHRASAWLGASEHSAAIAQRTLEAMLGSDAKDEHVLTHC